MDNEIIEIKGRPSDVFIRSDDYEFRPSLAKACILFKERFMVPERVFYPRCGLDVTPMIVFPDSEIIFMDTDQEAIDKLRERGMDARFMDFKKYAPEKKFDLLVLSNFYITVESVIGTVGRGGYILTNDLNDNTSRLLGSLRYGFMGSIDHDRHPAELLSVRESKRQMREADIIFPLYSVFRKRF